MQVSLWQDQEFGKGSMMIADPQGFAMLTVRGIPCQAGRATTAGQADFANHPPSQPVFPTWGLYYLTSELMPRDAGERVIAAHQFEVCGADTRQAYLHQRFTFGWRGNR